MREAKMEPKDTEVDSIPSWYDFFEHYLHKPKDWRHIFVLMSFWSTVKSLYMYTPFISESLGIQQTVIHLW